MQRTIMIVEDNDVNKELIALLIEQYSIEKKVKINILTASNGEEAVQMCSEQSIDLIFMDIMMPFMNGADATRIIKSRHPSTMIVVISTRGDEAQQKEMLINGAEDYMVKPINAPLFKSRLHNYMQVLAHRNHIDHNPKARNLFTNKVFHYHMDFAIGSDAELAEFWEAMLIRFDFQRHIEHLSDFVRFLYHIGTMQLKQKFRFHVTIEEDTQNFFFTLDNTQLIGEPRMEKLINAHYSEAIYLAKGNLITFVLQKTEFFESLPAQNLKEAVQNETVQPEAVHTEYQAAAEIKPATLQAQPLQTYEILDEDELEDFDVYLTKLRSLMLLMENSELEESDVQQICHCLEELSSITSISNDTFVISTALKELSISISEHEAAFEANAHLLFQFINAFVNDLSFWKQKIFYDGAPSVDFLNDSITTNANMFHALLAPEEANEESLDEIFDF